MKKLLYIVLIYAVVLAACSKKSNLAPANTVNINGYNYPIVVIGAQTWTALNYSGPGGVNYNGSNNIVGNGKLYTLGEASTVILPAGWRLPADEDCYKLIAAEKGTAYSDGITYFGLDFTSKELMSQTGWTFGGGLDDSGFNAVAVGLYSQAASGGTGAYLGSGLTAAFHTSSFYNSNSLSMQIYQNAGGVTTYVTVVIKSPADRVSIRFVKDN